VISVDGKSITIDPDGPNDLKVKLIKKLDNTDLVLYTSYGNANSKTEWEVTYKRKL
jgi:pyridoxine/pyridoxamine 5'-phosphate oxidase